MSTTHFIGDVHGNVEQLNALLTELGWRRDDPVGEPYGWRAPPGVKLVSVGDLVDRGPDPLGCLRTMQHIVRRGEGAWVLGNHEWRYRHMLRYLLGLDPHPPRITPGRLSSWLQLLGLSDDERRELLEFLDETPLWLELDGGRVVGAHARWERSFGRLDNEQQVRACCFGKHGPVLRDDKDADSDPRRGPRLEEQDTPIKINASEPLPERARWARNARNRPLVVWGHEVVRPGHVVQIGNTINVESGAYLGHALSAYIYPEGKVVRVRGARHWKRLIRRYAQDDELVFVRSLDAVTAVAEREGLGTPEEYVGWLEHELDRRGVPPLPASFAQAHRLLFSRAV